MVQTAVVVPIAVLASICVIGLVLIWVWFPRTWRKGVEMDQLDMDEAARAGHFITVEQAREQARAEVKAHLEAKAAGKSDAPKLTYVPPVAGY